MKIKCPRCFGEGEIPRMGHNIKCPYCKGEKTFRVKRSDVKEMIDNMDSNKKKPKPAGNINGLVNVIKG